MTTLPALSRPVVGAPLHFGPARWTRVFRWPLLVSLALNLALWGGLGYAAWALTASR